VSVVGGTTAPAGSFPWLAYVLDDQGSSYQLCSGTVVAANVVLTAAHCVYNLASGLEDQASNFTVVTGNVDWAATTARQVSRVTQAIVYPSFQPAPLDGDAALLVLSTPTTEPPITLATSADEGLIGAGNPIAVAGWGATSGGQSYQQASLQWGSIVAQAPGYCALYDDEDGVAFDPASQFCAIDPSGYAVSTCHGDSGGPAIAHPTPATAVQVGITSQGDPNCNPQVPSVFTRVDLVSPWVDAQIAAIDPPPPPPPPPSPPPATAAAPAVPPASSVTATPAPPRAGHYGGRSSQRSGRLALTLTSAGVTRLRLEFRLRCRSSRRGPFIATAALTGRPSPLSYTNGAWGFTTSFEDAHHQRFSLAGAFRTATTAHGTLVVSGRGGRCGSGRVGWSARLGGA
jgi:Trypsin